MILSTILLIATPPPAPTTGGGGLPLGLPAIFQTSLIGFFFLCLVFRKFIVPEWTLKDAEKRTAEERAELIQQRNEARDQLKQLQDVFQEQMIPALTRANEVNSRYLEEMQAARYRAQKRGPG